MESRAERLLQYLLNNEDRQPQVIAEALSAREAEIVEIIHEGIVSLKEIASRLNITFASVDYHLGNILIKIGDLGSMQLTAREIEILNEIRNGTTYLTKIADSLSISPLTVRGHLNSIYRKLGIGKSESDKKMINALISVIKLGLIENYQPAINIKNTPIYEIGAKHS